MEEIDGRLFSQRYLFVRHCQQPLIGGWDLFKNKESSEMVYAREIKFQTELDRDEYLPRITESSILKTKQDNGFIRCTAVVRRVVPSETGQAFSIVALFEHFESTFEKVMLKRIHESKTFSIKEILKVLNRLASSMEILERNNISHGDIRSGNIAVMKDGSLKMLWTPFNKSTLEMMAEGTNPGMLKVMSPSPEVAEAFNFLVAESKPYSGYPNMSEGVVYSRNDVYSLGILILKMSNMYSSEPYYSQGTSLKVNTKRVESSILKLHSLNKKLGVVLNHMLSYEPDDRWTFEKVVESLSINSEAFNRPLNIQYVKQDLSRQQRQAERSGNKNIFDTDDMGPADFALTQSMNEPNQAHDEYFDHFQSMNPRQASRQKSNADYQEQVPFNRTATPTLASPMKFHNHSFSDNERAIRTEADSPRAPRTGRPNFGQSPRMQRTGITLVSASPTSLFDQRGLSTLKTELISKLEQTIFFDQSGRLRSGIKIKESLGSKYVGEMFCGRRHGLGIQYYVNGDVCVGSWLTNDMDGECLYFQNDGSIYVGSIKGNKRDGFGKLLHFNGDVYEGNWTHSKKNGQGIYFYYTTDTVYDGEWVLNFKEGWGSYHSRNGDWVEGEWKSNKLLIRQNQGVDEAYPKVKNILEFYTNRDSWAATVQGLQEILDQKDADNNISMSIDDYQGERSEFGQPGKSNQARNLNSNRDY